MNYYFDDRKPLKERMIEKEQEILQVIVKLMKKSDHPPTVREITIAAGMRSTSTTFAYLQRLQKKGFIDWVPGTWRTLKVLDKRQGSVS